MTYLQDVTARQRIVALVLYGAALLAIQYFVVEQELPPGAIRGLWFYNGIASLLLGSRLLNPYFTPPGDAATNAFVCIVTIVGATEALPEGSPDLRVLYVVGAYCAIVLLVSIMCLLLRAPIGATNSRVLLSTDRAVRTLGSPDVIFTVVIVAAVWVFHRTNQYEVFTILTATIVIVALAPVDRLLAYAAWVRKLFSNRFIEEVVGVIVAHQTPGIVLIRQSEGAGMELGSLLLVSDDRGSRSLAIALNYVGRDEGNLLRALTLPIPTGLERNVEQVASSIGVGVAARLRLGEADLAGIPAEEPASVIRRKSQFCGIVDQDTSLDVLQFEVIEDRELTEGCLVEVAIGSRPVLYQVIEGLTHEDVVQQKNKYGYVRAKARKIGQWDSQRNTFTPVNWLPRINEPVFLRQTEEFAVAATSVGHFPRTSYGVSVDISEAVTHNTAILGILGIGKSILSIELVERMIAAGIKVICLDLTNQYTTELGPFLNVAYEAAEMAELQQSGGRGVARQNVEEGGTRPRFEERVKAQLANFLNSENQRYLRIYNPAQFDVWQQTSKLYQGTASMASLTACEITSIISEATLDIAQSIGMTDRARICLVFEEAHSLVPEWNSVASDGDKAATAATARAILQGRKYGLGCLLVTQRTANVTKTILNQCNTIFAMRTFDDTGKEFLSNYIGRDYATLLPSLDARHAVLFGKASSCTNPVLVRLNNRAEFAGAFRQANPPRPLPEVPQTQHAVDAAAGVERAG